MAKITTILRAKYFFVTRRASAATNGLAVEQRQAKGRHSVER